MQPNLLGGIEYKTENVVLDRVRQVLKTHEGKPISGEDLSFVLDLYYTHPGAVRKPIKQIAIRKSESEYVDDHFWVSFENGGAWGFSIYRAIANLKNRRRRNAA